MNTVQGVTWADVVGQEDQNKCQRNMKYLEHLLYNASI